MNRKKKINKVYIQKAKKEKRKNQPANKERYISKADRAAALAKTEAEANGPTSQQASSEQSS
jgi:hypothetical protein